MARAARRGYNGTREATTMEKSYYGAQRLLCENGVTPCTLRDVLEDELKKG